MYFLTAGQIIAGKPLSATGRDIYVWHDGALRYIGAPDSSDDSANVPGTWGLAPLRSRVSPDGRHLLFASHSGADMLSLHGGVDYDQRGLTELYLYKADTDSLACVSCKPSGAPPTSDADDTDLRVGTSASNQTWHLNHPLADDGTFVFFNTAESLVPEDVNGKFDAYEFDSRTDALHLISSGRDPSDSYFLDAGANGHDVFLLTRQPLAGWDVDENYDLYDARIDGGFPEPPPAPPACTADACRPASSAPPSSALLGSSLFHGAGNPRVVVSAAKRRVVHCRRGFVKKRVRRKVRCVRKRKAKSSIGRRVVRAERRAK